MIAKIFTLLSRKQRTKFALLVLVQFFASFLDAIGIISILPFLMLIIDPAQLNGDGFLSYIYSLLNNKIEIDNDSFLIFLGVLSAGLILISTILRAYTSHNMNKYIEENRIGLSKRLLSVYLNADYSFYYNHNAADASKTVISEVDYFVDKVFRAVVIGFSQTIFLVLLSSIFLLISPLPTLIALVSFIVLYLLTFNSLNTFIKNAGASLSASNEKRHKHIIDAANLIKMIKIQNQENFFIKKYDDAAKVSGSSMARFMTANQTSAFVVEGLIFSVVILAALLLIITNGGVEAPIVQELVPYFALFTYAVIRIKPAMQSIYIGVSSLKYLDEIIDNLISGIETFRENEQKKIYKQDSTQIRLKETLTLENVYFKYENAKKYQLEDINLKINKNDRVGIIGKSGGGKSTLLDLIMGLISPLRGKILVDGLEISNNNYNSWQSKIGYVPQEVTLLNDSLFINLFIDKEYTSEKIEYAKKCLRLADLENFVTRLETNSDKKIINEKNISGGQKQRIGIARALIRNPSLLILDEITSSLDEKSEAKVLESIYNLKEKTILIVSHKKENLYGCNKIFELKDGNLTFFDYS